MSVRSITDAGDWTFGRGKANYVSGSREINQRVVTRLRSFKNDWYLDTNTGVDWLNLLGAYGSEKKILRAIERTVMNTPGVISIENLEIKSKENRSLALELAYTDVFKESITSVVAI